METNPDVAQGHTTEELAKSHWIYHGIYEERQAMYGFDYDEYLDMHSGENIASDPSIPDGIEAIRHWQYFGIQEGRRGTSYAMPLRRVGIFYLGWHAHAASAMQYLEDEDVTPQNVQDIIDLRAQGQPAQIKNILYDHRDLFGPNFDLYEHAFHFHYHTKPTPGYYCIYEPKPPTPTPSFGGLPIQGCDTSIAQTHAAQLWGAGIDYVIADASNLSEKSPHADVIQLRPLEILFDEWQSYGGMTPQIAVLALVDTTSSDALWPLYLDLYDDHPNTVMRDPCTGNKVFFVVDNDYDNQGHDAPGAVQQAIAANRGKNDVTVIQLWGLNSYEDEGPYEWWFISPCIKDGYWTADIEGIGSCNQAHTLKSPIGSQVSIAPSYQLTHASQPGQSTGRKGGLTFRKQFETAFTIQPDNILIWSWNEFIAQPQTKTLSIYSTGLECIGPDECDEEDGDIPDGHSAWTDTYASEYSRDIEPTYEYGDFYYRLMKSCIYYYRQQDSLPGYPECQWDQP